VTRRGVVLVALQDALERAGAEAALRARGYGTVSRSGGGDALRLYARFPRAIRLIVADQVNGEPGGRRALRWARAPVPVLGCGGYEPHEVLERSALGPEVPFLPRPWSAGDLAARVDELVLPPPAAGAPCVPTRARPRLPPGCSPG
jgi:hypothetical protein